jgi:nitrite reductase/ring-hydroxylating ferredoxin subunit
MRSANYEFVGTIPEFSEGITRVFRFGVREIAIFQVDGRFYAVKNLCPHHGVELNLGSVENGKVRCPGHGFSFDLTTGACDRDPSLVASTYELKIEGDKVFIRL